MEEIMKALAFYLAGCLVARIMLDVYKIDEDKHGCVYLSWATVITLLLIRGK